MCSILICSDQGRPSDLLAGDSLFILTRPIHLALHTNVALVSQVLMRHLGQIGIMLDVQTPSSLLWSDKRQQDHISVHRAHEDTNNLAIIVAGLFLAGLGIDQGRERVPFAELGFDRRGRRRCEVAELIGCSDHERSQAAGRELHQVDWDDAPSALHAELLEEGGGDHFMGARECVGVEQGAANDGYEDDHKAATDNLTAVAHYRAARHGPKIGADLRDCDGVGGELELVLQHCRV